MTSSSPPETTPSSLVERVQDFIVENKRAILIGTAAVVAVGGVAAYYASSSRSTSEGDRRDKKRSKKKRTVKDQDGPILEERKPKAAAKVEEELPVYTAEQIAQLSNEDRSSLASNLKSHGNEAYKTKDFHLAVELYTRAIEMSPTPDSVFYSNRAACYMNLKPPQYDQVITDCTEALKLDPVYLKPLSRRAAAHEALEQYEEAVRDYTAATMIEKFSNAVTGQSVERALTKLSATKAKEIMEKRKYRLPSFNFIAAYIAAFRPRPDLVLPENPSQGDETLLLAFGALKSEDFTHALTLVNEAIEQGISWDIGKAEAMNLRGTFKFLMADVQGSRADFLESLELNPAFTQSWVKIASVYMEQNETEKAFQCFEDAIKHNPNDPDIYYHRGQVLFILAQFDDAAKDYTKSTTLDDGFVFSHIQYAVALYKSGQLASSMATFRKTLKAFPTRSEPHNYYGELLLDQQRFEDAIEKFDRAMELETTRASSHRSPNVLPLVNKALAIYQWKQDFSTAEQYCHDALRLDSECDAAVATLAQFSLQQTKLKDAIGYLERQAELARTEGEVTMTLSYLYATKAQVEFGENYPKLASELPGMAAQM